MEIKEHPPIPDYKKQFDELPFGRHMKLPMDMLTPVTIDDDKKSETEGPLEVFVEKDIIYIDDGCHRYYDKKRKLFAQNGYKEPDLSKTLMEVIKVDPEKAINNWILKI
jgi:hypothetical protein